MQMHGIRVLGFTLASIAALAATHAAEIASAPQPSAGGYKDVPVFTNWTGYYVGVNGGGGWDAEDRRNIVITTTPALGGYPATTRGFDANGGFGGGQIGYNWQGAFFGPSIVFGVEADIEGSNIHDGFHDRVLNAFGDTLNTKRGVDWFGTVRGRLGYSFGNFLVFGTGGFAYGEVHNRFFNVLPVAPIGTVNLRRDRTETGFAAGGGIEYMFAQCWSVKAEYQFIDLGSYRLSALEVPPSGFTFTTNKIDNDFHTLRVGVNYHFGSVYQPLK
jgi:outer membrane immunogenic protein